MTSLTAGSPKCNCKNPDTCIHAFTLKVKDREFKYKQGTFVSSVEAIDKGSAGVPVSLTLAGKTCVSGNPKCPQGVIYNVGSLSSLKPFNNGMTNYLAKFDVEKLRFFETYDGIAFLIQYGLKKAHSAVPKTNYLLRVGQCQGEPFVSKPLTIADASKFFNSAERDALMTNLTIYPDFKWDFALTIEQTQDVTEFSEQDKKKQQRKQNQANGVGHRGARGWTKLPNYEIADALDINGKLSVTMGSVVHDYSKSLKQDFKRKAKQVSLLNKSGLALKMITGALSTNSNGGSIELLKTEIVFPKFELKGSGELKEDPESEKIYTEQQLSIGLAPLIGMKITLDLLQAFAAWYRADAVLAMVRESAAAGEKAYKEGGNAAYAGMKFELIAEGLINLTLAFKTNAKKEWEFQKDDAVEVKLKLSVEANVRAGIRFYIAKGALEVGGKAEAEGCLGLESPSPDKVDIVFYHNGITAKVYVNYSVGLANDEVKSSESEGLSKRTHSSDKVDKSGKEEKEWIIHEKLDKKKSTHRISLS